MNIFQTIEKLFKSEPMLTLNDLVVLDVPETEPTENKLPIDRNRMLYVKLKKSFETEFSQWRYTVTAEFLMDSFTILHANGTSITFRRNNSGIYDAVYINKLGAVFEDEMATELYLEYFRQREKVKEKEIQDELEKVYKVWGVVQHDH